MIINKHQLLASINEMAEENKQSLTKEEKEEEEYCKKLVDDLANKLYWGIWGTKHCTSCSIKLTKETGKYRGAYPSRLACYRCKAKRDSDIASGKFFPGSRYENYRPIWKAPEDKDASNNE